MSFDKLFYNVCLRRLCRPMCGKVLPFRDVRFNAREALPPTRGVASANDESKLTGKAKPYRTSVGKAAR